MRAKLLEMFEIANKRRGYFTTGKTVFSCQSHVIWCTKYRRKVLDDAMQARLTERIREKEDDSGYMALEIETMPDPVHLLVGIPPSSSADNVIGKIKGYPSRILREAFPALKSRLPSLWTRSKFVSSCGGVTLEVIKDYIENQKNA